MSPLSHSVGPPPDCLDKGLPVHGRGACANFTLQSAHGFTIEFRRLFTPLPRQIRPSGCCDCRIAASALGATTWTIVRHDGPNHLGLWHCSDRSFCTWNHVWIGYCDGSSFSGRVDGTHQVCCRHHATSCATCRSTAGLKRWSNLVSPTGGGWGLSLPFNCRTGPALNS